MRATALHRGELVLRDDVPDPRPGFGEVLVGVKACGICGWDEPAFVAWRRSGGARALVVFDAIGVPGIINDALRAAPPRSRLVVVGVCMQPDTINPFFGISKELDVHFALGYDPMEFTDTLRHIAEGEIEVAPMITGEVGLDGVGDAFRALADPEEHCKILVVP